MKFTILISAFMAMIAMMIAFGCVVCFAFDISMSFMPLVAIVGLAFVMLISGIMTIFENKHKKTMIINKENEVNKNDD